MPKLREGLFMAATIILVPLFAGLVAEFIVGTSDWFHAYWQWAGSDSGG